MSNSETSHDSIVSEIHETRRRLAEQYQNDLLAFSVAAVAHCLPLGFKIIQGRYELLQPQPI